MPIEILLQRPACLQALLQLLLNADPECESIPFAVLRLLQSLASQLKQIILLSHDAGLQQVVDVGEARSTEVPSTACMLEHGPWETRLQNSNLKICPTYALKHAVNNGSAS